MAKYTEEQQKENRAKAITILREADESIRLQGTALEHILDTKDRWGEFDLKTDGKMCACAVVAKGLGIPLIEGKRFNYDGLGAALGTKAVVGLYRLNDKSVADRTNSVGWVLEWKPEYTFAEIGDELEARGWVDSGIYVH